MAEVLKTYFDVQDQQANGPQIEFSEDGRTVNVSSNGEPPLNVSRFCNKVLPKPEQTNICLSHIATQEQMHNGIDGWTTQGEYSLKFYLNEDGQISFGSENIVLLDRWLAAIRTNAVNTDGSTGDISVLSAPPQEDPLFETEYDSGQAQQPAELDSVQQYQVQESEPRIPVTEQAKPSLEWWPYALGAIVCYKILKKIISKGNMPFRPHPCPPPVSVRWDPPVPRN